MTVNYDSKLWLWIGPNYCIVVQEIWCNFHFFMMQFFPHIKKTTIRKYVFSKNRDTKTKLFLAVTIKSNLNMNTSFFMKSYVFVTGVCELYWNKILFSNIIWSQLFFFFIVIKFILTRICIQKHQIFLGLLLLIIWMFLLFLLTRTVVHS